jgi:hypothetical protein
MLTESHAMKMFSAGMTWSKGHSAFSTPTTWTFVRVWFNTAKRKPVRSPNVYVTRRHSSNDDAVSKAFTSFEDDFQAVCAAIKEHEQRLDFTALAAYVSEDTLARRQEVEDRKRKNPWRCQSFVSLLALLTLGRSTIPGNFAMDRRTIGF